MDGYRIRCEATLGVIADAAFRQLLSVTAIDFISLFCDVYMNPHGDRLVLSSVVVSGYVFLNGE